MAFIKFKHKPHNELEYGGRQAALQGDENEPMQACPNCRREIPLSYLATNANVCTCGYHFRISARRRLRLLVDEGSFQELDADLVGRDILDFPGYGEKLAVARDVSSEREAVITGKARIEAKPCYLFVMDAAFMMASMGAAVGEKITRLFEYALRDRLPVIGFTVSGGARMQEGILSLMQMAKTSAAIRRHSDAGLLYITVLTDPTTGGVTASFAMEGDLIFAEPGALIGFAGPRVIEQTTRKRLPKGFQRAEFLLEKGFVDALVPRAQMRETLAQVLLLHADQQPEKEINITDDPAAGGA